jgi:hypothetical protein
MSARPVSVHSVSSILLLASVALAGIGAPAGAQGYLGAAAGAYLPGDKDQDRTEVYGLRGGYRFRPSLGLEASLSKVDLASTIPPEDQPPIPLFHFDLQLDLYNLDLSLQWLPRDGHLVIFGGPGVAQLRAKSEVTFLGMTFSDSTNSNIFTAHAGAAYTWQVHDRFFIRPEARVRRYFDKDINQTGFQEGLAVSYKQTDYEANVIFGWRFGS